MNRDRSYEDYYVRQVGGALPVFAGGRVQRGHGLGSLFGSLIRSATPLIKSGAIALGKRALKTGLNVAGVVLSGQSMMGRLHVDTLTSYTSMGAVLTPTSSTLCFP